MNKTELIERVADEAGTSMREAGRYVDSLLEVVTEALKGCERYRSPASASSMSESRRPAKG